MSQFSGRGVQGFQPCGFYTQEKTRVTRWICTSSGRRNLHVWCDYIKMYL